MPIAHCFIDDAGLTKEQVDKWAAEWAADIGVDVKDVCLTVVPRFVQGGQTYKALVNLHLPSLWTEKDISRIQSSLLKIMSVKLTVPPADIFIMTTIIESGRVMENGEQVSW